MPVVHAFAALKAGEKLQPFEYELGPIEGDEIDIQVEHCGICHSDLSMIDNEWEMSQYPLVPGHEVIGTIADLGEDVKGFKKGNRVGLGWHAGYCMHCQTCLNGDHNMCPSADGTIVGRYGGFADLVRAKTPAVFHWPENLNKKEGGPLFCGGITVFNPLVQFDVSPTAKVGVIGIGGLGHLALQFLHAWGCRVTAFTSSGSKMDEAKELGAHETLDSRNPEEVEAASGKFDFILSTVNVPLKWNTYLGMLKPRGRLHSVGMVLDPLGIKVGSMLPRQLSVSSSPVGSPATILNMLDFASRHQIEPVTEHFPMERANEALDRLREGKGHYRIILDR